MKVLFIRSFCLEQTEALLFDVLNLIACFLNLAKLYLQKQHTSGKRQIMDFEHSLKSSSSQTYLFEHSKLVTGI